MSKSVWQKIREQGLAYDKWETPPKLYQALDAEFHFGRDPCPITWQPGDPDGLKIEWEQATFCNPPYSQLSKWLVKARAEFDKGKTVVLLINSNTDLKVFHETILPVAELRFVQGRLKFVGPNGASPHTKPSMIVILKPGAEVPKFQTYYSRKFD